MDTQNTKSREPGVLPAIMRYAVAEERVEAFEEPALRYDPESQLTFDDEMRCGGRSSGCTKATYSTPQVGKDPEGDYAADD